MKVNKCLQIGETKRGITGPVNDCYRSRHISVTLAFILMRLPANFKASSAKKQLNFTLT